MSEFQVQPTGIVIPFPNPAHPRVRIALRADEPRGKILLFTGIRYEWQSEPKAETSAPPISTGPSGTSRRRRRS
ncbi:MAG TPA: hypothetical protein VH743_15425 [Beijerinckiaceae bacterium]|jgi:hypothetical protein